MKIALAYTALFFILLPAFIGIEHLLTGLTIKFLLLNTRIMLLNTIGAGACSAGACVLIISGLKDDYKDASRRDT